MGEKKRGDWRAVARLAKQQHGVVVVSQLEECGTTARQLRRRVDRGEWRRVCPGAYAVAASPVSWHQTLKAVTLALGDEAFISHAPAAQLLGIGRTKAPRD
jgi:hypothetical protein